MVKLQIREAREDDVPLIRDLFTKIYGTSYRYREFYDDYWLKKTVYSDNYLFLVATEGKRILGSASIYYDIGSYTDLLGEFGRLVVDPGVRERGIGTMLMKERRPTLSFKNRAWSAKEKASIWQPHAELWLFCLAS